MPPLTIYISQRQVGKRGHSDMSEKGRLSDGVSVYDTVAPAVCEQAQALEESTAESDYR